MAGEPQGPAPTPGPVDAPGPDEARWAAFVDAYRDHAGAVYGLALQTCGAPEAADLTKDVFVRFWRDPEASARPQGAHRATLLQLAHDAAAERASEPSGHLAMRSKALDALPPEEGEAIATALHAQSYRIASTVLREPERAVRTRIRAGLQRLRSLLDDDPAVAGSS